jgi:predicted DCC family thiol-disulfide oxidoreductase YuxK
MAHLILYDGVCGLCQGVVQFVLRQDGSGRFQFAALQSDVARDTLALFGVHQVNMETFYVVADYATPGARLLDRSDGALFILSTLGGPWRAAGFLAVFPKGLRDAVYDAVRKRRYAWFGKTDQCLVPAPEQRARFLDVGA